MPKPNRARCILKNGAHPIRGESVFGGEILKSIPIKKRDAVYRTQPDLSRTVFFNCIHFGCRKSVADSEFLEKIVLSKTAGGGTYRCNQHPFDNRQSSQIRSIGFSHKKEGAIFITQTINHS